MWWAVEGRGVQYGYTIPAGLNLNWEVPLEEGGGLWMVEYSFEGRIFEGCSVYVSSYPVVIEYGSTLRKIRPE